MNLLSLLKTLPMRNHAKFGLAINYADIYNAAKMYGLDNKDVLNFELKKLADNGSIELFGLDGPNDDLYVAARVKQN